MEGLSLARLAAAPQAKSVPCWRKRACCVTQLRPQHAALQPQRGPSCSSPERCR